MAISDALWDLWCGDTGTTTYLHASLKHNIFAFQLRRLAYGKHHALVNRARESLRDELSALTELVDIATEDGEGLLPILPVSVVGAGAGRAGREGVQAASRAALDHYQQVYESLEASNGVFLVCETESAASLLGLVVPGADDGSWPCAFQWPAIYAGPTGGQDVWARQGGH
jgi:hypothetical protein